jgi:nucleoside 2-deoxyribosyltransferase
MRVYIAAPFFNEEQLKTVKFLEDMMNLNGIEFFSPRSEGTLKQMGSNERKSKMGDLFQSNIDHMDWCTHAIAVIDGYDKGVLFEMGYLYAEGKTIVSYTNNYQGINVMLNEAIACHCEGVVDVISALEGTLKDVKTGDVT